MGKKNKKGKVLSSDAQEMSRALRREILGITNQLLESKFCSKCKS